MSYSTSTAGAATGLAALEERLRDDFVTLGWPAKAWIPPSTRRDLPVHDVIVIGADSHVIQGEPLRDRERLIWTLDLRPA